MEFAYAEINQAMLEESENILKKDWQKERIEWNLHMQ